MTMLKKTLSYAFAIFLTGQVNAKTATTKIVGPVHAEMSEIGMRNQSIYPKASSILKKMLLQYLKATKDKGLKTAAFSPHIPFTRVVDGKLLVEISTYGHAQEVLESLKVLGLTHGTAFYKQISGFIPFDKLEALLEHQGVRFVQPSMSMTHVGDTTTQGDQAMLTDEARISFQVDGTGVKVGVISDSFDAVTMPKSLADDVASGDLPPNITGLPASVPVPPMFGTDEGRAMLQIVHDVAPGAQLFFRTGSLGEADFAQGITDLLNAGVDVAVDDVLNFMEPWFQDGIIAQSALSAISQGMHYFSAAANLSDKSYQAPFTPSAQTAPTDGMGNTLTGILHDFDPTAGDDSTQPFTLQDGEVLVLVFQWAQPFTSACVGDCAGPTTNLDIALFDMANNLYVAASGDNNVMSGSALEILQYQNTSGGVQNLDLIIANVNNGPSPQLIKYILPQGPVATLYHTTGSTCVGHANGDKVIAVASSAFFFTPEFGENPPLVNDGSSLGGTPIFFNNQNLSLAMPLIRENPDVTGPDGGNNTFFGDDIMDDIDLFPNFFGTSAASPHVAGLAALILDNSNTRIAPALMEKILEASALDIFEDSLGNPLAAGFDFKSGLGLVQAAGEGGAICGDVDADNVCIDEDKCPDDPRKTKPGRCGCGATEASCHGPGGGSLSRGYPTLNPIFTAPGPFVEDISPLVPPMVPAIADTQALPEETSVLHKEALQSASRQSSDANDASTSTDASCTSLNGQPRDLMWLLLAALFFLWRRMRLTSASRVSRE